MSKLVIYLEVILSTPSFNKEKYAVQRKVVYKVLSDCRNAMNPLVNTN